jgi:hypothetical protein
MTTAPPDYGIDEDGHRWGYRWGFTEPGRGGQSFLIYRWPIGS